MILPVPSPRWQRVAITALLVLPLLLIVVLSAPAWAALPFLSEPRRDTVIKFLGCLIDWIKAIPGPAELITKPASHDAPDPQTPPEPDIEEEPYGPLTLIPNTEPLPSPVRAPR